MRNETLVPRLKHECGLPGEGIAGAFPGHAGEGLWPLTWKFLFFRYSALPVGQRQVRLVPCGVLEAVVGDVGIYQSSFPYIELRIGLQTSVRCYAIFPNK